MSTNNASINFRATIFRAKISFYFDQPFLSATATGCSIKPGLGCSVRLSAAKRTGHFFFSLIRSAFSPAAVVVPDQAKQSPPRCALFSPRELKAGHRGAECAGGHRARAPPVREVGAKGAPRR